MTKHRTLTLRRLKPECVQSYITYHQQVSPELLEAYRQAGITKIDCYLNKCDLVVSVEFEENIHEEMKDALSHNPVEVRWQELMESLRDIGMEEVFFEEVFHWER